MNIRGNNFSILKKPSIFIACSAPNLSYLQCKLFDIFIGSVCNRHTKPNSMFKICGDSDSLIIKFNLVLLRNTYLPKYKLVDVEEALKDLVSIKFVFNLLNKLKKSDKEQQMQLTSVFVHSVKIYKPSRNMCLYLSHVFCKHLRKIDSHYLILNLKRIFQFKNKYSYILYQLIADYRGTANCKGIINLPLISFKILKKILKIDEEAYKDRSVFQRDILEKSILDINEKAEKGIINIKFDKLDNNKFYKYNKYADTYYFNAKKIKIKDNMLNNVMDENEKTNKSNKFMEKTINVEYDDINAIEKQEIINQISKHFSDKFNLAEFEVFYEKALKRTKQYGIYSYIANNEYDWYKYIADLSLKQVYKILLHIPKYMDRDGYLKYN